MLISRKYPRTHHYKWSPGTTSDDRINHEWWGDMSKIENVIHTEKMDGEGTCLNSVGVFARSHATPTKHPWADYLKVKHSMIVDDLRRTDTEIFGENLYAVHSILYPKIENHFYVFGVRVLDKWLSWEEVKFISSIYDLPTVPEFGVVKPKELGEETFVNQVLDIVKNPSTFDSIQNGINKPCTMEGVVSRNIEEYHVDDFSNNLIKYVRKDHVKTDKHWSSSIKRAPLQSEVLSFMRDKQLSYDEAFLLLVNKK